MEENLRAFCPVSFRPSSSNPFHARVRFRSQLCGVKGRASSEEQTGRERSSKFLRASSRLAQPPGQQTCTNPVVTACRMGRVVFLGSEIVTSWAENRRGSHDASSQTVLYVICCMDSWAHSTCPTNF